MPPFLPTLLNVVTNKLYIEKFPNVVERKHKMDGWVGHKFNRSKTKPQGSGVETPWYLLKEKNLI
jgi:hypothetical protein